MMKVKKYGLWVLPLVILLVSIKAIIFTRDLVMANYYLQWEKEKAPDYLYRILHANPFLYRGLRDYQKNLVGDLIVKKAVYARYRDNKNVFAVLARGSKELSVEQFKTLYRDNFYLQYLFPPVPSQPNWKNLDTVSLELLADRSLNSLTLSLWEKVKLSVDPEFTSNLADYCRWQGNTELAEQLEKDLAMAKSYIKPGCPTRQESFKQLLKVLRKKKLTGNDLQENRIGSDDFNDKGTFRKKWEFSGITSVRDIHVASFTMGRDEVNKNSCLRLMGFFAGGVEGSAVTNGANKAAFRARGGAIYKDGIPVSREYYLLSFDYLTITDKEKPSFYVGKGLSEAFLPVTGGTWRKAIYILNNTAGTFTDIKPIFRMWGTGTVLIDNIYFATVTKSTFGFNRMAMYYTTRWE
jgi:hypothetical protein